MHIVGTNSSAGSSKAAIDIDFGGINKDIRTRSLRPMRREAPNEGCLHINKVILKGSPTENGILHISIKRNQVKVSMLEHGD
jgi:hypothetical protein